MSPTRRTFLQASAATLCLTKFARAATAVIRAPYIQRLLADRVSILWTTAQPASGYVILMAPDGGTASFSAAMTIFQPSVTRLSSPYYQYQADLTGLDAGVRYKYQVVSDGQMVAGDPYLNNFRTPTTEDFSFLVFGDSGEDSTAQLALIKQMSTETNIAKVIHVGDLAYDSGTFAQLESNYFTLNAPLMSSLPFFTTPGNHEYLTGSATPYLAGHATPASGVPAADTGRYYSYDWGDAHFVSIDSNLLPGDAAARMLSWLEADLAATRKYWKIVFLHHPPYPTGTHADDPICAMVVQNINPIVERHGVQLVLTGHEHGYERSFPLVGGQRADASRPSTTYVITGGGGAELHNVGSLSQCSMSLQAFNYLRVDVTGTTLTFKAIGLDGNVLDRVTLTPPPAVAASGVLNSGDFSPAVAPGSLVTLFGQNLAKRPAFTGTFPLPSALGGVSVTANGIPAPILYASPSQLNVQMPFEVSGAVTMQVTTANGSVSTKINVVPAAPAILAVVSGNGLNSIRNPATRGSYVTLYLTGLGAPAGHAVTGQPAPGVPMPVTASVQVTIDGSVLQPLYAGLAPGFAGLDQINFQVPGNLADGVCSLRVLAGGIVSTPVVMTVGPTNGSLTDHGQSVPGPVTTDKMRRILLSRATRAVVPVH